MRRWRARGAALCAAAFLTCELRPDQARAEPRTAPIDAPTLEASAGADATAHGWSIYSGLTASIGGSLLENGWRIRLGGGYGEYARTVMFADALVGYQQRWGALTLKLFAGVVAQHNGVTPIDFESSVRGTQWGAKGAIEAWLDIGADAFGQLDLTYATLHESYGARLRLGYKFTPQLSVGPEAGVNGNSDYDSGRIGAFVRYDAARGEISVSAGAAGDRAEVTGGYATINALLRF